MVRACRQRRRSVIAATGGSASVQPPGGLRHGMHANPLCVDDGCAPVQGGVGAPHVDIDVEAAWPCRSRYCCDSLKPVTYRRHPHSLPRSPSAQQLMHTSPLPSHHEQISYGRHSQTDANVMTCTPHVTCSINRMHTRREPCTVPPQPRPDTIQQLLLGSLIRLDMGRLPKCCSQSVPNTSAAQCKPIIIPVMQTLVTPLIIR